MRNVFKVSGDNITIISASPLTLAFVNPGTTASLEFIRAWCSQRGSTTSAQQGISLQTQASVFPTLVSTAPTQTGLTSTGDQASKITGGTAGAAGTSGINASAEGAGTKSMFYPDNFNVLTTWLWTPSPIDTFVIGAGSAQGFGLVLTSTPATLTGWSFGIEWREW